MQYLNFPASCRLRRVFHFSKTCSRWRYFAITLSERAVSAFLLVSLSAVVHWTVSERGVVCVSLINSIDIVAFHCSSFLFSLLACVVHASFWIFFIHRRTIRKQKRDTKGEGGKEGERVHTPSVRMHNARDSIFWEITICLVWLMRTDSEQRYYWSSSGYVREIRRVNSPMDSIYSCIRPVWHGDAKAKEAWKRRWLEFIPAYDLYIGPRGRDQLVIIADGILH